MSSSKKVYRFVICNVSYECRRVVEEAIAKLIQRNIIEMKDVHIMEEDVRH